MPNVAHVVTTGFQAFVVFSLGVNGTINSPYSSASHLKNKKLSFLPFLQKQRFFKKKKKETEVFTEV
jgi:hypothetical protein